MCEQLATEVRRAAEGEEWKVLSPSAAEVPQIVETFLETKLMPLAAGKPEYYNENGLLGRFIQDAVEVADILDDWPSKLHKLVEFRLTSGMARGRAEQVVQSAGPIEIRDQKQVRTGRKRLGSE